MKRLFSALLGLGISASTFAAYPAATDPTIVNVPQLPGGFFIGGTLLYLQPSAHNGDLDYVSVDSGTTSSFFSSLGSIDPSYDWAWGLNIGYIFPNTGNDINLSYLHFSTRDTRTNYPVVGVFTDPINIFDDGNEVPQFAAARAKYDLNQVDLTAGQYIDVGCRLILHPNAGLRWAQVERRFSSFYTEVLALSGDNDSTAAAEKSDFSGIGPLVGIDATYYIGLGFGAVAHVDSALLIGDMDVNLNSISGEDGTDFFTTSANANVNRRIVPVTDAKLGFDYTYVFNNLSNSDLTLEAGWQFSNYYNAIDRIPTLVASDDGTSSVIRRTTSDLGINGPYVSLVFHA